MTCHNSKKLKVQFAHIINIGYIIYMGQIKNELKVQVIWMSNPF